MRIRTPSPSVKSLPCCEGQSALPSNTDLLCLSSMDYKIPKRVRSAAKLITASGVNQQHRRSLACSLKYNADEYSNLIGWKVVILYSFSITEAQTKVLAKKQNHNIILTCSLKYLTGSITKL